MIEFVTQPDSTIVCAPLGNLDVADAIRLRHVIGHLAQPGLNLVIDLGGANHAAAIGISAVIGVSRMVHSRGGTLTVSNAEDDVRCFLQRLVGDHCLSNPSARPGAREPATKVRRAVLTVLKEGALAKRPTNRREQTMKSVSTTHEPKVTTAKLTRQDPLVDPMRNRGVAFTATERKALNLIGRLPSAVLTLDQQAERAYRQLQERPDDLAKNIYMEQLHDRDEVLYFRVLLNHLTELLPIVYDPVVGDSIENYSNEYRRPRGVYLSIDHPEDIEASFSNLGFGPDDVDLIVCSDAEEILGIGDWGVAGIEISVGKLAVYTAAAGIHPDRVIPVSLDVGTNNETLLNDPLYLGNRHARVRGKEYDSFIQKYLDVALSLFPNALLHFEDFGAGNARRILFAHRDSYRIFNDDVQGTGAVVLAGLLNAVKVAGTRWHDQRVVIFGGGTAGIGIADQIRDQMMRDGLSGEQATSRIWVVDLPGLLSDDMGTGMLDYQRTYARPADEVSNWAKTRVSMDPADATRWPEMAALRQARSASGIITLQTVVEQVKPTILVGCSTAHGAFTQPVIEAMSAAVDRPIIFPISNPFSKIEAMPADIINWSDGRALVSTGLPQQPVDHGGVRYWFGQANNALVYPGLGLGAIVAGAKRVTDNMVLAAAEAVAGQADVSQPGASLLPVVEDLRASSATAAIAVVAAAIADGVATTAPEDPVQAVHKAMWQAVYEPLEVL